MTDHLIAGATELTQDQFIKMLMDENRRLADENEILLHHIADLHSPGAARASLFKTGKNGGLLVYNGNVVRLGEALEAFADS